MYIHYMKELLAIKECENFSRAAEMLYMTQPALSRHVAEMEKELGVKLIDRDKHKVEFTEVGLKTCKCFQKILCNYDTLCREISDYKSGMSGKLRLGMLYYTIRQDFGDILLRFKERYPDVEIKRYSYQPQEMYKALIEEKIDIGVLAHADYPDGDMLQFLDIFESGFEVMLPINHSLAAKERLTIEDLEDEITIWLRDDSISNISYLQVLGKAGYLPRKTIETDNIDTVPSAIIENGAIYIKAEGFGIGGYEKEIITRPLQTGTLSIVKSYVYRSDHANPIIELFLEMVKERLGSR